MIENDSFLRVQGTSFTPEWFDRVSINTPAAERRAATLTTLVQCCAGDDRPDSPILAELEEAGEGNSTGQAAGGTGRLRHQP